MADRLPPEPPKSPKKPNLSPDKKAGGFNWRVFILFALAIGILTYAWQMQKAQGSKELNLAELQQKFYAGEVYQEGDHTDGSDLSKKIIKENNLSKKSYTRFTTAPSIIMGNIQGKFNLVDKRDLEATPTKGYNFKAIIDSPAQREQFHDFADEIIDKTVHTDNPIEAFNKEVATSENSTAADIKEIKFAQLRKLFYRKELSNLRVFHSPKTDQLLVEGHSLVYPILDYKTFFERLKKVGKFNVTEKQFEEGYRYADFSVLVTTTELLEKQKAFIQKNVAKRAHDSGGMSSLLMGLLPILLVVIILIFLFRHQMKSAGKGAMNFGKSKARLLSQDRNKVTFKDVAGIQEAKEELYEIVDFLKGPKKFEVLGGNIPKGVLMVGPPGTGKTLLARAIAGEADVPFFSISGSDFVEMFVGVGASRVRDMFEQGKKNSPCIVFIDEIDAVGRHRGQGHGGGHDEREQTLNALLVEMDGFDAHSGVIIIAATNRPDVLDPALLRPGRFDRQVTVALPDYKGREQILEVHAKKIKLKAGTDLTTVSRGTPGFSGAELANLINEAALLAARRGLKEVTIAELEEARDKVRWGRERRSLALSDKDKANTAYHEAGHAICNLICDNTDSLHKVTIIPRGPALGMAMFLPTEDRVNYREAELIDQLCVAMGGRVAEEIVFGNVTNGAMGDIRQATSIARKMVCEWGMSKQLGMVDYGGDDQQEMFMSSTKSYSEDTAQKIDLEIKELIDAGYKRAQDILLEHREALNLISEALLEFETLDGEQIADLLHKGVMDNPPSMPTPPEPPMAPESGKRDEPKEVTEDDDNEPLAPEAVGAPA